jgi:hypothetical protein
LNELPVPATAEITEELVARLGRIEGLDFPVERLPAITARLRELHEIAAVLESIEPIEIAPASRFDPAWPDVDR